MNLYNTYCTIPTQWPDPAHNGSWLHKFAWPPSWDVLVIIIIIIIIIIINITIDPLFVDLAWFGYTPTWWQTPSAASSNVSGWLDQTHPLPTFGHGRGCISWSPAVALMVAPPQFPWHVFNFEGGTFKSVCIKHYTTMQDTCTCGYVVYLNIFTRHIVKSEKKHSYTQSVWKAEAECKI